MSHTQFFFFCGFAFLAEKNKQLKPIWMKEWNRRHAVSAKQIFPLRTQFQQRFVALRNLNRHSRLIPIHLTLFTACFFAHIIVFFFLFFFYFTSSSSCAEHTKFCITWEGSTEIPFLIYPILIFAPKRLLRLWHSILIPFYLEFSEVANTSRSSSLYGLKVAFFTMPYLFGSSVLPAYKIQNSFCMLLPLLPPPPLLLLWRRSLA